MTPLTPRELQAKRYITTYNRMYGVSPTHGEVQQALGYKSKASAHRLITSLEQKGHIEHTRYRARGIDLKASEIAVEHVFAMIQEGRGLRQILETIGQERDVVTLADVIEAVKRAWLQLKEKPPTNSHAEGSSSQGGNDSL